MITEKRYCIILLLTNISKYHIFSCIKYYSTGKPAVAQLTSRLLANQFIWDVQLSILFKYLCRYYISSLGIKLCLQGADICGAIE